MNTEQYEKMLQEKELESLLQITDTLLENENITPLEAIEIANKLLKGE